MSGSSLKQGYGVILVLEDDKVTPYIIHERKSKRDEDAIVWRKDMMQKPEAYNFGVWYVHVFHHGSIKYKFVSPLSTGY
jgi:hypothetical protein